MERNPQFYNIGYEGRDLKSAPLYISASAFDTAEGDFNQDLVERFNRRLLEKDIFPHLRLKNGTIEKTPSKVVIIDASDDRLAEPYETVRVIEEMKKERGWVFGVVRVDTRDELEREIADFGADTLILSFCVDRKTYNVSYADELTRKGFVIVPGPCTAPGGLWSDKDLTYRLLSNDRERWDLVARYLPVEFEGKSIDSVARGILDRADELQQMTGRDYFYVKPTRGGGGLGGFRLLKVGGCYVLPDLSRLDGKPGEPRPALFDPEDFNEARLSELAWIYYRFLHDEKLRKNYIKFTLDDMKRLHGTRSDTDALYRHMKRSLDNKASFYEGNLLDRNSAEGRLVKAIAAFEPKYERRYVPLVNEFINFGTWGMRLHLRYTKRGVELESLYARIFQIQFSEDCIGYIGTDNITNKATGDLEACRMTPVNEIMLTAAGGEEAAFDVMEKGITAAYLFIDSLSDDEKSFAPIRVQMDMAPVAGLLGEGNADTARGLCLGARFSNFISNTREWVTDSLEHYSRKKSRPL